MEAWHVAHEASQIVFAAAVVCVFQVENCSLCLYASFCVCVTCRLVDMTKKKKKSGKVAWKVATANKLLVMDKTTATATTTIDSTFLGEKFERKEDG